jgi:TetR/AcrR family transcriptional repressor of nem operon
MGDLSTPFREKLLTAMDGMVAAFASILDEAKALGEIPTDLDSRETAIFMVEAWHGAIIRMKVTNSPEPLELFSKFIFEKILK